MSKPAGLREDFGELSLEYPDVASESDSNTLSQHLLAGLERQKEELGPIADELIALLHRLGAADFM
jgi:hypothetical protein